MTMNRITPTNITELKANEVFVFGSNLSGIHGAGAAKTALKFGAEMRNAIGIQGSSYAIPTKDASVRYSLDLIVRYFIEKYSL